MVRNRTIAKVLRQLSLMEEWGSGYHRVTTACKEDGHPIPNWFEIGPVLRVVYHVISTIMPCHFDQREKSLVLMCKISRYRSK